MKKSALTTTVAVLFVLYALINLGSGLAQFGKASAVSGTTSLAADLGKMAGDHAGARKVQTQGYSASAVLYLIALFILATAVTEMVAAIGLFTEKPWALKIVITAAVCGILVEIQDIAEDGFGVGALIFLAINALALLAAASRQTPKIESA